MSGARTNRKATNDQPAQPGDLQDGVLIVRFQFTRMIGAGGMGEVWEAKSDDLPGMRFAVKIVSLEHVRNHDVVSRFFGEARAASAIDDPNIVVIHGTGRTEDGRPALVMQYIEGVSLADMCEERGPLPIDAAGKILLQSASALRAAHSRNITHRDIKPQNIMVVRARWGREWFVIVVDFGIAKFHDTALAREIHTNTQSYLGTPGYSAPEQILGKAVDAKADIYALGVVAYRIMCGRLPYLGANGMDVLNRQLNAEAFPEPRELRPDMPRAWNDAILAALDPASARRPTASEFAKRLAEGMRNGASLLASLAPRIATDSVRGAGEVTLSGDVPTALSQLEAQNTHRRSRLSTATTLIAGVCIGAISTGFAFQLAKRPPDAPGPADARAGVLRAAVAPVIAADAAADSPADTTPILKPPVDARLADARSADARWVDARVDAVGAAIPDAPRPVVPLAVPVDTSVRQPPAVVKELGSGSVSARTKHAKGVLNLRAVPWADCFLVDGGEVVSLGTTPITTTLPVGAHRVRFKNDDRDRDEIVTVVIDAAKPALVEKNW